MKKILLIVAVALGVSASVNAQVNEFGLKAGFNYSAFKGDDAADDQDGRVGFHFGAMYHLGINDDFAFQPELLVSTKGANDLNLTYLDIPLLAHVHITEPFSVHFGPQPSFLLSAKNDGTEFKDFIKSIDVGVVAGATYRMESGLFFDLRYNYGILTIGEEIETTVGGVTTKKESEISNSVGQLSVGWMF